MTAIWDRWGEEKWFWIKADSCDADDATPSTFGHIFSGNQGAAFDRWSSLVQRRARRLPLKVCRALTAGLTCGMGWNVQTLLDGNMAIELYATIRDATTMRG